jgi:Protein of unknown function (DUF3347)
MIAIYKNKNQKTMTRLLKVGIPALAVVFLAACANNAGKSENSKDSVAPDPAAMNEGNAPAAAPVANVQLKDDKLNAVYQQYALLTTALTDGDMPAARIAANAIAVGAKEVADGAPIGAAAANITAAADIEAQRNLFAGLSNEFIALVKKSGLNSGTLYVDFCAMAMNDKGASWLSANKDIKNPYFGDKMMTCGNVQETIQ